MVPEGAGPPWIPCFAQVIKDDHACGRRAWRLKRPSRFCENVDMRNITVTIDDNVHRRARIKAAERGISVSAAVREFLIHWAGEETDFARRKRLQDDTLRDIDTFRVGDRLPRAEAHRRGGLR